MSKINLNDLDKYAEKEDFQRIKKHVNGDVSKKKIKKNKYRQKDFDENL